MNKKQIVKYTRVGDFGPTVYALDLLAKKAAKKVKVLAEGKEIAVKETSFADGVQKVVIEETLLSSPLTVQLDSVATDAQPGETVITQTADEFEACEKNGVLYRLWKPKNASGPRPLVLYLHGGGESGVDNWKQLVACYGPVALAEAYPDCWVMAPQAKPGPIPPMMLASPEKMTFATTSLRPDSGWSRTYVAQVCDLIRGMVAEGKVLADRIYVTGASMGGAGTITAMTVASDLFAAAVPICPTMMPETFNALRKMTTAKVWVAASYVDHTIYRHKYLVDAIMELKDAGNKNAKLTLYSPEDLAKYGIGTAPDLSLKQLFGHNHACWIPAYHDEYGVISWMMEQVKGR